MELEKLGTITLEELEIIEEAVLCSGGTCGTCCAPWG